MSGERNRQTGRVRQIASFTSEDQVNGLNSNFIQLTDNEITGLMVDGSLRELAGSSTNGLEQFSDISAYEIGNVVWYEVDDEIYRCINTISTGKAFDTSDWIELSVGVSAEQTAAIAANTAKTGYTEALVSANTSVVANTAKIGITTDQTNDILSNNSKVGITLDQSAAIVDNTAKVGYTDALVSANLSVVANTAKVGYTEALVAANPAVALNTAKQGITEDQSDAIRVNTAKVGITPTEILDIQSNNAKVGITAGQASAIIANTAKSGVTSDQAMAITVNTAKVGYTEALVEANPAVVLNTAKVGYTEALVAANPAVALNTAKVGYTEALVAANPAVALNTVKVGYTEALVEANPAVVLNTAKVGYTEALVAANPAVALNTAKIGITNDQGIAILANSAKTSNATHTGEVTGSDILTISSDVVDEDNLKISNVPNDGDILEYRNATDQLTWSAPSETAIVDGSVEEIKLEISNEPVPGTFLQYKDSTDEMTWAIVDTNIANDSIAEVKLDISNNPVSGDYLQYRDGTDELTWMRLPLTFWDITLQYLNLDTINFEGAIYSNREVLVEETYNVGVTEMEVQEDNGVATFIFIKYNGATIATLSVNADNVTADPNGVNYSVLIGHTKYTSVGATQATGDLGNNRTLENYTLKVDTVAVAGESPSDDAEHWIQISLADAQSVLLQSLADGDYVLDTELTTALLPYLTTADHIKDGITEFVDTYDYDVGDLVYYKDPNNNTEEQIFYEVYITGGMTGVGITPLTDTGGPEGVSRFTRTSASAVQGTKADDAINILGIKLDGDTTTTLADAVLTGSTSISFTSEEGKTKVFTPTAPGDGTTTIKSFDGTTIGSLSANQSANQDITLPVTNETVINETIILNADAYVVNTFYALDADVTFEDHIYKNIATPPLYEGAWDTTLPYLTGRIVLHNGLFYRSLNNGATPGQEPGTGAVDGDGEPAWGLVDVNPTAYPSVWIAYKGTIITVVDTLVNAANDTVPSTLAVANAIPAVEGDLTSSSTTAVPSVSAVVTAINVIPSELPTQTTNAGKVLGTDGSSVSWVDNGTGGGTSAPDLALKYSVLLTRGFLFTEGTAVGTRTPYTGTLTTSDGEKIYFFDSSDDGWYATSTGGTKLVGF